MIRRDQRPRKGGGATEARPGRADASRWRLRNWRLGTKLFAVLLIPALAVVALVGLRIGSDLGDARQLAQFAARGRVDSTVAEVVHELQRERDLTVRFVAGNRQGDVADLNGQRQKVDAAIGTFERTLADGRPRLDAMAAESLRQTDDRLHVLGGLRYSAEHSAFPADAVLRSYSDLISGLLDISDSAAADVSEPDLARLRLAGNALARIKDQMSVKRAVLAEALAQGTLDRDRMRALLGAEAELAAARNDYRTFATPEQQRMFDDTVIGMVVDIGNQLVDSALTRAENGQDLHGLDADQWDTSATHTVNLTHQVQQALLVQLQERTDALASQARTRALWDGGVVLGVLLLAGVLSVVIARTLLRPLRILRRTALEVAEHRLPSAVEGLLSEPEPAPENLRHRLAIAPVPVFTREEVGQVARAFDRVHGEALRLAGEQAMLRENVNAMFVNLSQRSQDLVERQLSVLDRMEANEQDPDTLAGLFELDHLATRMRRNSENLLVLSGTDLAPEDAGAVAADEIVGAALSEVEHYQRIELAPAPHLSVRGDAVNDLVHVISELLENATRYSGDQTTVTVDSAETSDGEWQIEIIDRGAGMPQAEIDRTNARLAKPPEVDVEVSRRMGLFVVATLAARHHIDIRLRAAENTGLVATVLVPSALIVVLPTIPSTAPATAPAAIEPPSAPEPVPLLAPLAPLAPLTPEPDPEPAPEPEPEAAEPVEAGPPRRAPVVERESVPQWPAEEQDSHLDVDAPTERMPAYRDVLSRWFDASRPAMPPVPAPASAAVPLTASKPESVPAERKSPEPVTAAADEEDTDPQFPPVQPHVWPTAEELEQEDGAEDTWPFLHPAEPEGAVPQQRPILSLSPDAVRERMTSLQGGFRRGRHARGEDTPTD